MTATPSLSPDIFGKYQKKISDAFYLDRKESEYVYSELRAFALEVLSKSYLDARASFTTNTDPGDEHA